MQTRASSPLLSLSLPPTFFPITPSWRFKLSRRQRCRSLSQKRHPLDQSPRGRPSASSTHPSLKHRACTGAPRPWKVGSSLPRCRATTSCTAPAWPPVLATPRWRCSAGAWAETPSSTPARNSSCGFLALSSSGCSYGAWRSLPSSSWTVSNSVTFTRLFLIPTFTIHFQSKVL